MHDFCIHTMRFTQAAHHRPVDLDIVPDRKARCAMMWCSPNRVREGIDRGVGQQGVLHDKAGHGVTSWDSGRFMRPRP
jgi:hypothetical protein